MIMKLKGFIFTAVAAVMAFAACQKTENLGMPDLRLSAEELTFGQDGGAQTITIKATRDWTAEIPKDANWVVLDPESGEVSLSEREVTITTLANEGMNRTANVKFTIGMKTKYLKVTQSGPSGSAEDLTLYFNDFDKEEATKSYGTSSSSWPYLDQFAGWKNARGTGAANVSYAYTGMSVRANSTSDSNYSDYDGSGMNNMFFGSSAYFVTNNIALNGGTGLTLTFGTEKYSTENGSVFQNSEYKIYLSNDGAKWVELTDYTFAGGTSEGRWNVATANFSVPEGTEKLSICMQVTVPSSYRLDDMKLVISDGGTAVDFSKAVEMDFTAGSENEGGNTGGETPTPPAGDATMTIAQVLAHSEALPSDAVIEGVVISNMGLNNLTSKKGMYVQDETAGLQFYLAENHSFAFGDKVQINLSGVTVGAYNGAVQISNLALAKIAKVSSGNTVTPKTVTMADFLANKYEGQYIALEGVQVASSDLSKTFVTGGAHTSINMEDANGNKFVVFSSKYATYGAETVPQGSGTIKGISSLNNGTMQIIFTQTSDYAGLTGTRFDGAVVTPPAGGGEDGGEEGGDEGGEDPVTPPTGDVTVAKLVMNTLGLANAASVDGKEIKVDDNITLVFKKGSASTAPAYYDASQGIRMYQNGATLDVKAASGKTISSIKFTFDYQQWYIAPNTGELSAEGDVRTWTGSANTVKFTSTGTDKNHRAYVKAIEVTYY